MLAQTRRAGLEQAGSPRGGSSKQQRSDGTAHSCSRPEAAVGGDAVGRGLATAWDNAAVTKRVIGVGGERSRAPQDLRQALLRSTFQPALTAFNPLEYLQREARCSW